MVNDSKMHSHYWQHKLLDSGALYVNEDSKLGSMKHFRGMWRRLGHLTDGEIEELTNLEYGNRELDLSSQIRRYFLHYKRDGHKKVAEMHDETRQILSQGVNNHEQLMDLGKCLRQYYHSFVLYHNGLHLDSDDVKEEVEEAGRDLRREEMAQMHNMQIDVRECSPSTTAISPFKQLHQIARSKDIIRTEDVISGFHKTVENLRLGRYDDSDLENLVSLFSNIGLLAIPGDVVWEYRQGGRNGQLSKGYTCSTPAGREFSSDRHYILDQMVSESSLSDAVRTNQPSQKRKIDAKEFLDRFDQSIASAVHKILNDGAKYVTFLVLDRRFIPQERFTGVIERGEAFEWRGKGENYNTALNGKSHLTLDQGRLADKDQTIPSEAILGEFTHSRKGVCVDAANLYSALLERYNDMTGGGRSGF